ncbi:MAG: hypothetical protein R2798_00575 [Chitinophagales bacterium]|nr:DUF4252 domain-containing protein [Bacteroidota bacterium]MCB9044399.1 DUF4252 domain-containing protein [Chitinophagales bacterium]
MKHLFLPLFFVLAYVQSWAGVSTDVDEFMKKYQRESGFSVTHFEADAFSNELLSSAMRQNMQSDLLRNAEFVDLLSYNRQNTQAVSGVVLFGELFSKLNQDPYQLITYRQIRGENLSVFLNNTSVDSQELIIINANEFFFKCIRIKGDFALESTSSSTNYRNIY